MAIPLALQDGQDMIANVCPPQQYQCRSHPGTSVSYNTSVSVREVQNECVGVYSISFSQNITYTSFMCPPF